jgi:MoaA/NifB/PqqE/SkfB family radical SAM enzyme
LTFTRKLKNNIDLVRGLLNGRKAFAPPLYVNIDATHRCNLKCAYCRWHSPLVTKPMLDRNAPRDLDPEIFDRLCACLEMMGGARMQFVGAGEPMLHPQFMQMMQSIHQHRLQSIVYTNGTLLTEKSCQALMDFAPDILRISMGAFSEASYSAMHPYLKPGMFQKILTGITRLAALKAGRAARHPILELCIPIDRENMKQFAEMAKMAHGIGINRIHYSVVLDFNQDGLKPFSLNQQEVALARKNLQNVRHYLDELGLLHNMDDVLLRYKADRMVLGKARCYTAWYYAFIRTDGKVAVCQRTHAFMGDLAHESFTQIWNGANYQRFRQHALQAGLNTFGPDYDCDFCPHLVNNHRVHRHYRRLQWLAGAK